MAIEALIFDVDGTLADTEELHRGAFNEAFDHLGLGWYWDRATYKRLLAVTGGKERLGAWIEGLPHGAHLRERIAEIHAEKTRLYTRFAAGVPLRSGVRRLIDEAQQAGLRLAIASTTSLANVEALLGAALERFEVVACGDEVARKKPAPDIYDLALARLRLPPSRAIALEDSQQGLRSAVAAGLWTVVTPTYWTEDGDFSAAGLVLPDLGGLGLGELLHHCRQPA